VNEEFVADSSVAIAWAVPSQSNEDTDRLLDEISQGARAVVPVLWFFEVANSLIVLARRGRLTREDCALARHELGMLLLESMKRDTSRRS
jgi:predicted nucleic acid-binding protein